MPKPNAYLLKLQAQKAAEMALADAKDDKTLGYTKGKLDFLLEELLGEAFTPYEERYAPSNLLKQIEKKGVKR